MLRRIAPKFSMCHQSHYTTLVRESSVAVLQEPRLVGPLTLQVKHEYRMCQHLRVTLKGSAAKPIDLYIMHSPGSKKHVLNATVRTEIIQWFADHAGNRALIG